MAILVSSTLGQAASTSCLTYTIPNSAFTSSIHFPSPARLQPFPCLKKPFSGFPLEPNLKSFQGPTGSGLSPLDTSGLPRANPTLGSVLPCLRTHTWALQPLSRLPVSSALSRPLSLLLKQSGLPLFQELRLFPSQHHPRYVSLSV